MNQMPTAFLQLTLAILILISCGCRTSGEKAHAQRSTRSKSSTAAKRDYKIVDHSASSNQRRFGGKRVFVVGEQKFTKSSEFLGWVASLPKGTTLHWDSGCAMYSDLPLEGTSVTMQDFRQFCQKHGVDFTWRFGF